MRKTADIFVSILLSFVIVWLGSGIMTVVCEHTGNVSIAKMEKKLSIVAFACSDEGSREDIIATLAQSATPISSITHHANHLIYCYFLLLTKRATGVLSYL